MSLVRLDLCLGDALDTAATALGNAEGWIFETERVTFAGMRVRVDSAARALLHRGIGKGDIVATWMENRSEWAVLQMACSKIGAIIAPLNTRYRSEEARFVLEHSNAQLFVYSPSFLGIDFRALVQDAIGDRPGAQLHGSLTLVELDSCPADGTTGWDDFINSHTHVDALALETIQAAQRPEDPVMLQYTSGTTAFPKGALLNHTFVLNYAVPLFERLGVRPGDAVMNTQPFYHSGGACGALPIPLTFQCRIVSPSYYEAEKVLSLIERERCVVRSGHAAMYLMEINHPRFGAYDLSSLRAGWCAGPREVLERVRDKMGFDGLTQLYASTEGGGSCGSLSDTWEQRAGSHGRPFDGTEIMIADPSTQVPLPVGETGEIWTRGWCRMNGYLNQPDETAKITGPAGWITSHDLGFLDEDGYLHYVGRLKDMLKPGGENVSAEEVEAYLMRHPAIRQVAVIGLPDERLGEAVTAVVEPLQGQSLTEADVIAFCRGRIANYKVPQRVFFTEDWPMTGSGKIQKFALRDRYLAESDATRSTR